MIENKSPKRQAQNFTADQIDILVPIAKQCPLKGGNAVFRARSLLALADEPFYFEDAEICEPIVGHRSQESTTIAINKEFKIFPNLTDDAFNLTFFVEKETTSELIIYDIMGQIIKRVSLNPNENNLLISTTDFQNGLYFCEIYSDAGLQFSEKLLIIR